MQDVQKVATAVFKNELFTVKEGRKHSSFPNIRTNPLWNWKVDKTMEWIEGMRKQFRKYRGTVRGENEFEPEDSDNELEQ